MAKRKKQKSKCKKQQAKIKKQKAKSQKAKSKKAKFRGLLQGAGGAGDKPATASKHTRPYQFPGWVAREQVPHPPIYV